MSVIAGLKLYVNGVEALGSHVYMPIEISHGRSNPESQFDAPTLNVTWADPTTAPVIGDQIKLVAELINPFSAPSWVDPGFDWVDPRISWLGTTVLTYDRFFGIVTDVQVLEASGVPLETAITAVGWLADLGRIPVFMTRPIENDVVRMQAIAAQAGTTLIILGDPGPDLAIAEIDTDCLSAYHDICQSSGGIVWQDCSGAIIYGTGNHRESAPPKTAIPAHAIISGLDWTAKATDLINHITVSWGPEDARGEHTLTNDLSIGEYGIRAKNADTGLNAQTDADLLGNLILGRRSWPFSRISDMMLDTGETSGDEAAARAFFFFAISDAILLPIPPDPGPTGLMAEWIIEGWQEEWPHPQQMTMQLAVTDRARFALTTLRTWGHALPGTWASELARGTWLDALILQSGEAA